MSFVLDTSITMRWYFGDGSPQELSYATRVLDAIKTNQAVVPTIWGLEVANVLVRSEAKGLAMEARSEAFVGMLQRMNISVDSATFAQSLAGTLQIARRYKLSAYDSAYLEIALRDGLSLASLDEALLKAAKRAGVKKFDMK